MEEAYAFDLGAQSTLPPLWYLYLSVSLTDTELFLNNNKNKMTLYVHKSTSRFFFDGIVCWDELVIPTPFKISYRHNYLPQFYSNCRMNVKVEDVWQTSNDFPFHLQVVNAIQNKIEWSMRTSFIIYKL